MSTLIWLTVPQRITGKQAHLSIPIVPHLGAGRLKDFGLSDRPARLKEISFELRTRSAGVQQIANRQPTLVSVPTRCPRRAPDASVQPAVPATRMGRDPIMVSTPVPPFPTGILVRPQQLATSDTSFQDAISTGEDAGAPEALPIALCERSQRGPASGHSQPR
jgi:hypothetical protein